MVSTVLQPRPDPSPRPGFKVWALGGHFTVPRGVLCSVCSTTGCLWSPDFFFSTLEQADLKSQLGDAGYVVFGVVLFVWELLPTTLVVYFFRVRSPTKDLVSTHSPFAGTPAPLILLKLASRISLPVFP